MESNLEQLQIHRQTPPNAQDRRIGTLFLLALGAYFLLQVAVRLCLSESLDLDEAEQAFVFQQLHAGYGTQPPLYAWLQWVMFSLFGLNLFALSLLKNLLLSATYLCLYFTARPLLGIRGAVAVTASMLMLPAIGWESQRDLTHSVLLTCAAAATLCCYFSLLRRPHPLRYVLFGVLVGLGLQSKYNFAIFVAGLAIASLLVPAHRKILWTRHAWLAIAAALLCLLPHGWWLLHHFNGAVDGTLQKMSEGQDHGYLRDALRGAGSMLVAALSFITPLWIVYGLAGRRYFRQAAPALADPQARFFLLMLGAFFALLSLLVLSGEVTHIKSRWMLPLLFSVPLAFFVVLPGLAQAPVYRRITQAAAVFAVIILLALPLRVYLAQYTGKNVRAHHPYPELSAELAHRFPQVRTIVTDAKLVAGNLHFQRPQVRTLLLDELLAQPEPLDGEVLLLTGKKAPPGWFERVRAHYPLALREQGNITLDYRYGSDDTMSFDFVHVFIRKP